MHVYVKDSFTFAMFYGETFIYISHYTVSARLRYLFVLTTINCIFELFAVLARFDFVVVWCVKLFFLAS